MKCPHCERKCNTRGALRLHLITKAKQEAYELYIAKGLPKEQTEHLRYVERNTIDVPVKMLKLI